MTDVVPLLKQGLSTMKSGQIPEISLLKALVSKVLNSILSIVRLNPPNCSGCVS